MRRKEYCTNNTAGICYVNMADWKEIFWATYILYSVGGLGKSRSTAELSGLVVDSVVFNGATNGVRIKTWQVIETIVESASSIEEL